MRRANAIRFHPSGKLLFVGGGDPGVNGTLAILQWPGRSPVARLADYGDCLMGVALDRSGQLLALAAADARAEIWRLPAGNAAPERLAELKGHTGPVLAVAFDPAGGHVVTAGADRSVKVWSARDGQLVRTLSHHTEAVYALAFRPLADDSAPARPGFCASASEDRTVRVWQPTIGRMVRIVRGHAGAVFALAYSQAGNAIYAAGKEGVIRQIDAESDAILSSWPAHSDWIYALAASPDGTRLASGSWSGEVRIWDLTKP